MEYSVETRLVDDIALIISNGRYDDASNIGIANDIVNYLKKSAKREEVKPKRGIGWVSQNDLYRGK